MLDRANPPRGDGLCREDGFSLQRRLSGRQFPKPRRQHNLDWHVGCQSPRIRQFDTHPARESPFSGTTARHHSSGEAAGTGASRTASRWKNSILIRQNIWG